VARLYFERMPVATTLPEQVTDPASIPVGTELGDWHVVSWAGRGMYGTVYRVERRGRDGQGHYALKLALHPRDERFERERELLSRMNHPNVPRLEGHGLWQHPSGPFPYLVMQWVTGTPLYPWAAQRNPTSRQVLRLLAQVARALEATAQAGAVHRDVKGDNVLVRLSDERAFLTDFGAGVYRGAATVTLRTLPPGTPQYRSPEAWAFQATFNLHPSEHYRGSTCDDLFALGVTAYRLVTDEYPPPTDPGQEGSEVWARGAPRIPSARALNPRVCAELDALILGLLGPPHSRFKGQARLAAEALEHAADTAGPEADTPLFEWEKLEPSAWPAQERRLAELYGHRKLRRDKATVRHAEQLDAAVRVEAAHATPPPPPVNSSGKGWQWLPWAVPVLGALVLVAVSTGREYRYAPPSQEPAEQGAEAHDADTADGATAGAAEEAQRFVSADPEMRSAGGAIASGTLKGPLPGQRRPPCPRGEEAIRGGCWLVNPQVKPPCTAGYYEWDGRCYLPSLAPSRQPTSEPR